ncbi:hypothetical protein MAHJHV55_29640 [Mycobacterium avium subsp. hominissuis]
MSSVCSGRNRVTGTPSGAVIRNVNVLAATGVIVVPPDTSVNPFSDADSPSPPGVGSVIPGMPDVPSAVDAGEVPDVLLAV